MEVVKYLMIVMLGFENSAGFKIELRMVTDVIKLYGKQMAVIAKVCWGAYDKVNYVTAIIKTGDVRTIQFTDKIKIIEKYNGEDMLIMLDLSCEDSAEFLDKANKNNKFEHPYQWIIFSNSSEHKIDFIPTELKNLSVLIDSEVIIGYNKRKDGMLLRKVYKIDSGSDFIIEPFAKWTLENGLTLSSEAKTSTAERRKNVRGKQIGVSIVSADGATEAEMYNLNNTVADNISKCTFHNILALYDYMNATTKLLFTNTWGYFVNGSWNGMIGHMIRGEADICSTAMLMTWERAQLLSFLTQPVGTTIRFVFREPPLSLQNNLFYLPFRSTVWVCVAALILVLIVVTYITATWEARKHEVDLDDPTVLRPKVSDVTIFVAGAVVQQSSNTELKGSLGRVVTFIMFMIFLFLYTSYSANIVALLQSTSDQIRTLSDLLDSKFELGVEDQPYARYFFTTASDRVRKAIYDNKVARSGYKPNFMPMEEGVKKLRNINVPFAFHMNTGVGYKFIQQHFYEHEKCGLRDIEYIPDVYPWVSCRKRSPYKEIYKTGLSRIIEHGISDRVNRLIYARKPTCANRGGNFGSVNMMDFHPVLLCLLHGMVAALVLLGLEIFVHKQQMRMKNFGSVENAEARGDTEEYDVGIEDTRVED